MKQKEIRCPKGPARIYLLGAIGYIFVLISDIVIKNIFQYPDQKPVITIIQSVLFIATNSFKCRTLYSKRYDNMLIIAVATTVLPFIASLFIDASLLIIGDFILYLLLISFTYITIKMPGTAIREKFVKFRFVIPLTLVVLTIISTVFSITELRDKMMQTTDIASNSSINIATVVLPIIITVLSSIIPILGYVMLINWLSDPYEKEVNKKKDGR